MKNDDKSTSSGKSEKAKRSDQSALRSSGLSPVFRPVRVIPNKNGNRAQRRAWKKAHPDG